jgi:hypothetical protein
MYITMITVYLLGIFYFIVNTGWKVEMILELPRPPQATQQQQQEAGKPLLQFHSSYFHEGKVYRYSTDSAPVLSIRMFWASWIWIRIQ